MAADGRFDVVRFSVIAAASESRITAGSPAPIAFPL
jgi:hypothetical protein